jgi:hypothetical protein
VPGYDDALIGKRLLWQIEREIAANQSRDGSFHVTVCGADNETLATRIVGSIAPGPLRVTWARFACRMLNRACREGGTWIVVWCEPRDEALAASAQISRAPTRVLFLWKDSDGDIPTGFDCVQQFETMVAWGPTWFVDQAARAIAAYREHLRESGIRPRDTIKEALGQAGADPRGSGPSDL